MSTLQDSKWGETSSMWWKHLKNNVVDKLFYWGRREVKTMLLFFHHCQINILGNRGDSVHCLPGYVCGIPKILIKFIKDSLMAAPLYSISLWSIHNELSSFNEDPSSFLGSVPCWSRFLSFRWVVFWVGCWAIAEINEREEAQKWSVTPHCSWLERESCRLVRHGGEEGGSWSRVGRRW